MSETVSHIGKLTKISVKNKTTEQFVKEMLKKGNIEMKEYHNDIFDCLTNTFHGLYFYHKKSDTLYRIDNRELNLYDNIIIADKNEDGTISYQLKYYNGGASFDECLNEALDKMLS